MRTTISTTWLRFFVNWLIRDTTQNALSNQFNHHIMAVFKYTLNKITLCYIKVTALTWQFWVTKNIFVLSVFYGWLFVAYRLFNREVKRTNTHKAAEHLAHAVSTVSTENMDKVTIQWSANYKLTVLQIFCDYNRFYCRTRTKTKTCLLSFIIISPRLI